MKMNFSSACLVAAVFLAVAILTVQSADSSACGSDWTAFKDEKCIKIIDETHTYDDALKACHANESTSTLLSIRSAEEQTFMVQFFFTAHKVIDAVWLGAKLSSGAFRWTDESSTSYTNWATGSPSNSADKACVQMIPEGTSKGKWADEPCAKKNLVVCQKMQTWSLSRLQQTLLNARKELQDAHVALAQTVDNNKKEHQNSLATSDKASLAGRNKLQDELDQLHKNPVPVGFIYVQFPSQPAPASVWPTVTWENVSSKYAGYFFRAEGGNAPTFGNSQSDAFQGHSHRYSYISCSSATVYYDYGDHHDFARYCSSSSSDTSSIDSYSSLGSPRTADETRPINYAVRIWKRTA